MTNEEIHLELSHFQAGSQAVALGRVIHAAMINKGFWDEAKGSLVNYERHIWKQFAHLAIEIGEYYQEVYQLNYDSSLSPHNPLEELADVIIVYCDLAGNFGYPVLSQHFYREPLPGTEHLSIAYGKLTDRYRKTGGFDVVQGNIFLDTAIANSAWYSPGRLRQAVYEKMIKNLGRPTKYGTPDQSDHPGGPVPD